METVLHVLNGLEVGGKERVALQLARRAARDGLHARLLLFDSPFRSVGQDFDPAPLPVHFLPRGPGMDLRFAAALARQLRELRVDVVHAHNDSAIFYACVAARLVGRRRPGVCATFHVRPGHATRSGRLLTRLASRRAAHVTAVSAELAQFVVREGWAGRCETVWNGVDSAEFSPEGPGGGWREQLGVPAGTLLVAHIGRLDPLKRQADLLVAARRLAERGVELVVVLVGQGALEAELRSLAAGSRHVRFLPRVMDVAAFLREVDVLVLCSAQEAAPRVLLEAMSCGRAVVATRVGGIVDMLRDAAGEDCGVLVEPAQPEGLAAALQQLSGDPQRRAALGRRARARAAAFSADEEWRAYRRIYAELSA